MEWETTPPWGVCQRCNVNTVSLDDEYETLSRAWPYIERDSCTELSRKTENEQVGLAERLSSSFDETLQIAIFRGLLECVKSSSNDRSYR